MQNNDTKKKTEKISEDSFSSKNNTALFFSLAPSIGSVRARVSRNERLFVCACVEVVAAQQEEISLSLASLFCCLSLSLSLVHCRFLSLILSLLSHCLSRLNLFSLSNNNVKTPTTIEKNQKRIWKSRKRRTEKKNIFLAVVFLPAVARCCRISTPLGNDQ